MFWMVVAVAGAPGPVQFFGFQTYSRAVSSRYAVAFDPHREVVLVFLIAQLSPVMLILKSEYIPSKLTGLCIPQVGLF